MALKEVTLIYKADITYVLEVNEESIIDIDEALMRKQAELLKDCIDADHVVVTEMTQFVRDIEEDET